MMDTALLLAHAAATWFLVGLIWFVQVVHYPLLGTVPKDEHVRRTTPVVAPPMLIELACAVMLVVVSPGALTLSGFALLAVVWLSTMFVQVPLHRRLQDGAGDEVVATLVRTNWIRTVAWSLRGVLALGLLVP